MLYPEPLSLRFDNVSMSALRANALDHFGVAFSEDRVCRTTGRIVAAAPDGQRVLDLHPDTDERRSRIRVQQRSRMAVDAAVISEKLTAEGRQFSQLELEGAPFLLTCVGVDDTCAGDDQSQTLQAFANHVASRHHGNLPAAAERNLAAEILSPQALDNIADHADKPRWSGAVLTQLAQDISISIANLDLVECHGDCHLVNFVRTEDGSGGMLPSHFSGAYPQGYDLATALWSLLQTCGTSETLAFCRVVGRRVQIERAVLGALTDLVVLRCIWWLGLRVTWRDHFPFECGPLVERHLEFALNVRILQHQIEAAISLAGSGHAHER